MATCLLYLSLALGVTFLTNIVKVNNMGKTYYVFPILLYALFVGCRYDTGTDWITYKEIYESILSNDTFSIEFIYYTLNKILRILNFDYIWLFCFFAFFQILLIYSGFYRNKLQNIITFGIVLYFLGGAFLSSMNIMRQALVFCIFFNSIPLITKRKFISYLCVVILMIGIHTASIVLLPAFFLGSPKITIKGKNIVLVMFILSIILGEIIFKFLGDWFFSLIKLEQFARYGEGFLDNKFEYGIGVWILKLIDIGLIWFSDRFKTIKNRNLIVIYWLFIVGAIINNLAIGNQLIIRLAYCFISFRFILLAVLISLLYKEKREKITLFCCFGYGSLAFMMIMFVTSILKNNNGIYPYSSIFEFWV